MLLLSLLRARGPIASVTGNNCMPRDEIYARLDELPCFAVVDEDRRPPPGCEERYIVHIDAEEAEASLEEFSALHPAAGLRIVAVGMGFGLQRPAAVVTASPADILRARSLPGGDDIDWEGVGGNDPAVPLFGCFGLKQRDGSGGLVTPLFLSWEDAEIAIRTAEEATGEPAGELRSTSVQEMARMMAEGELSNPSAMKFVPSHTSVRYCARLDAELLAASEEEAGDSSGTLAGELREAAEAPTKSIAVKSLSTIFDGDRTSRDAKNSGLFPD